MGDNDLTPQRYLPPSVLREDDLWIGEWVDIPGLSVRLNGLKRQEWRLLNELAEVCVSGPMDPEREAQAREIAVAVERLDRKFARALEAEGI